MAKYSCTQSEYYDSNVFVYLAGMEKKDPAILGFLQKEKRLLNPLRNYQYYIDSNKDNTIILPSVYQELLKYSNIKNFDILDYLDNNNCYVLKQNNEERQSYNNMVESLALKYSTLLSLDVTPKYRPDGPKKYATKRIFPLYKDKETKTKQISMDAYIMAQAAVSLGGKPLVTNNTRHFTVDNLPKYIGIVNKENGLKQSAIPYSLEGYLQYLKVVQKSKNALEKGQV